MERRSEVRLGGKQGAYKIKERRREWRLSLLLPIALGAGLNGSPVCPGRERLPYPITRITGIAASRMILIDFLRIPRQLADMVQEAGNAPVLSHVIRVAQLLADVQRRLPEKCSGGEEGVPDLVIGSPGVGIH